MLRRKYKEFKYIPYEKWLENKKKADEQYKKNNELLKANGYTLWGLTGIEMNLMNERSLNLYINDGLLVLKDGKMFNRSEVLAAIREGREPKISHKSLDQLYGEWFGLKGTERQKLYAGKILLEVLYTLNEMKKVIPYYTLRFKDVDREKLEETIEAIKRKIENIKDSATLIKMEDILNGDFSPKGFKAKALKLLELMNFKGEKGKQFEEQMKKILDAVVRG